MRKGDWKVIVNYDGTRLELYNLKMDVYERENLADKYPARAARMSRQAIRWFNYAFRRCAPEIHDPSEAASRSSRYSDQDEMMMVG